MITYKGYTLEEKSVYKYGSFTKQTKIYRPDGTVLAIATGVNKSATDRIVKNEINKELAQR